MSQSAADKSESSAKRIHANLNVTWQFVLYDNLTHSFRNSRILHFAAHLAVPTMKWFCRQTCALLGDSCSITAIISADCRIVFVNNEIVVNLQLFEAFKASLVANKTARSSEDAHKSQLSNHANNLRAFFLESMKFENLQRFSNQRCRETAQKLAEFLGSLNSF